MTDAARQAERQAWIDKARERDILDTAIRLGAQLKRNGSEHVGGCPVCGGKDKFAINVRKGVFNCGHMGGPGGDVIALVQHVRACGFNDAVAWLTDETAPALEPKPRSKNFDKEDADYRAREMRQALGIWERGLAIEGTPAEAYLAARGLDVLPPGIALRFDPHLPYWHGDPAQPIHNGPALLGVLTDGEGTFTGCHITWLDPGRPGAKVALHDPSSPEELLPAKKLRGSMRKAAERLVDPPGTNRLVIGEGRETVLSVWLAETSFPTTTIPSAYWSGVSLGNLGGKAAGNVAHPTLKTKAGKAARVGNHIPEPQPDRDLVIPDRFTEIVLLGDGDSDRFTTEMHLRRAAGRWDKPGRVIKVAWALAGLDFNDMLRRAA